MWGFYNHPQREKFTITNQIIGEICTLLTQCSWTPQDEYDSLAGDVESRHSSSITVATNHWAHLIPTSTLDALLPNSMDIINFPFDCHILTLPIKTWDGFFFPSSMPRRSQLMESVQNKNMHPHPINHTGR